MLTAITRHGIVSRLSCNLFNEISRKRITVLLNRQGRYAGGYGNRSSLECFLKRYCRTSSESSTKSFSTITSTTSSIEYEISSVQYEKVCDETLDSLTEYFEELVEAAAHLSDADVFYGDGVLTVKFGDPHGTYVINRQTPNKQIWLSSPKSGPKRYDFINGQWMYKHDGKTLHELLNNEIPAIIRNQACFDKCSFSGREKQAVIDNLSSGK